MWTGFTDNYTCKKQKMDYAYFLVESDLDSAIAYLERVKRYNPYGPSCACCGDDYTIATASTMHGALQVSEQLLLALRSENKILIITEKQVKPPQ